VIESNHLNELREGEVLSIAEGSALLGLRGPEPVAQHFSFEAVLDFHSGKKKSGVLFREGLVHVDVHSAVRTEVVQLRRHA
jgi:hypothetical protein